VAKIRTAKYPKNYKLGTANLKKLKSQKVHKK